MSYIFRIFKGIVLWGYARNTWQYDVLCVLILAFIFLTPKSWFAQSELSYRPLHQTRSAPVTVLIRPESDANQLDRGEIENRVRSLTGRPETVIEAVRERHENGKIVAYEVDIR